MVRNIDPGLLREIAPPAASRAAPVANAPRGIFASLLAQELGSASPLKFSAHAQSRLQERGIDLDAGQQARLGAAVQQAASKGGRSSLVLMDGVAYVVSVPNRTVVTAVPAEEAGEQVFTNIDSTVLAAAPSAEASAPQQQTQSQRLVPFGGSRAVADRLTQLQHGDF